MALPGFSHEHRNSDENCDKDGDLRIGPGGGPPCESVTVVCTLATTITTQRGVVVLDGTAVVWRDPVVAGRST